MRKREKQSTAIKKTSSVFLLVLNLVCAVFCVFYSIWRGESAAANGFGVLLLIVFACNAGYAAWIKKRAGLYYLVFFLFAVVGVVAGNFLSLLPLDNASVSPLSEALLCSIYLAGAFLCLLGLRGKEDRPVRAPRFFLVCRILLLLVSVLALIAFSVIGVDILFHNMGSVFETSVLTLIFYFSLFALAALMLALRFLLRDRLIPSKIVMAFAGVFCIAAGVFSMTAFVFPTASAPQIASVMDEKYREAFGGEMLDTPPASVKPLHINIPGLFFNPKTTGYQTKTDVLYYEGALPDDTESVQLRYDVYYPDTAGPHSVIIRMHGRGGDKGTYNFPTVNKHLASEGYVVYDIQVGDYLEKPSRPNYYMKNSESDYLFFMRQFIRSARQNNDVGANWNSVFVSGMSFGGMLADSFAAHWGTQTPEYQDLGITLKGVIPFYPASHLGETGDDWEDDTLLINEDTPPCLMYLGERDGFIDMEIGNAMPAAYEKIGRKDCVTFWAPHAGHGSDSYFNNSFSQMFYYYMERFLYQYR